MRRILVADAAGCALTAAALGSAGLTLAAPSGPVSVNQTIAEHDSRHEQKKR